MKQYSLITSFLLCLFCLACQQNTPSQTINTATENSTSEETVVSTALPEKEVKKTPPPAAIQVENPNIELVQKIIALSLSKEDEKTLHQLLIEVLTPDEKEVHDYTFFPLENGSYLLYFWDMRSCGRFCYNNYRMAVLHPKKGVVDKLYFSTWEDSYTIHRIGENIIAIEDTEMNFEKDDYGVEEKQMQYFWITEDKLCELKDKKTSKKILRLARNSIFASKGYYFKSEDLVRYFDQKDWYNPKHTSPDGLLSDFELEIANGIRALEQEVG